MFLHLSVILSTGGGPWGVYPSMHWAGVCVCIPARTGQGGVYHLWGRQPPTPWADTPHTLGRHPPPPTTTAVDGTHPTGTHSCFNVLYWPRLGPQFLRPILAKKWNILIIIARKGSLRRLCFYRCVSVHGGGSTWAGTPPPEPGAPPRTRYTPWAGTPRDQVHPLWDQVQPPSPGPATPPSTGPGTPLPSSACWEIRATSGRYASYWNAFLLDQCFYL